MVAFNMHVLQLYFLIGVLHAFPELQEANNAISIWLHGGLP